MKTIEIDPLISTMELRSILDGIDDDYLLIVNKRWNVTVRPDAVKRMMQIAYDAGVAWLYGDYVVERADGSTEFHPTCDYLRRFRLRRGHTRAHVAA